MKTKLKLFKLLLLMCCAFVAPAVFGQNTPAWWTGNGIGPNGYNIGVATNWAWSGGVSNQPTTGVDLQFNGSVAGPITVYSIDGINHTGTAIGGGFGANGVTFELTGSQTSPVTLSTTVGSSTGMGFNGITLDPGAASFTVGDNTANQLVCTFRPSSGVHTWANNSSSPLILMPNFQVGNGGGSSGHVIDFTGTGNFYITNNLNFDNGSTFTATLEWDVTGNSTTIWAAGGANDHFNNPEGPIVIDGGTIVITSPGLMSYSAGSGVNTVSLNNIGSGVPILVLDATAQSDTIQRTIAGNNSVIQVNNGTWNFDAANTYTLSTNILDGGELIAGFAENPGASGPLGEYNLIEFNGGTLGFSVNNVFDYSPSFSTAAGQQYKFDAGGQNVVFTNTAGLASSGGTLSLVGPGSLTLQGPSSYSGATTIGNNGKLVFQGTKTGTGSITVNDGATLGIFDTGTQVTPSTLTVGTSSGATLEFNNVHSTSTAPLAAVTLAANGTITINVNSGTLAPNTTYPLFTWTGGVTPAVSLGTLNGFVGNLSINGNAVDLNITATAYKWTGANNNLWDTTQTGDWIQNGGPVVFANGAPTLFDDTATSTNVVINGLVQPSTLTVDNNALNYTMTTTSGNDIGGTTTFTKTGTGSLTNSGGFNSYTGVTTLSGGVLSVSTLSNGGSASDIGAAANSAANVVLNGGTLQYTGSGASIDRLFSLGTSGGTIDASGTAALVLNNTAALGYSGTGARTLGLTGTDATGDTLASSITDHGGATAIAKTGSGTWILTGTNSNSGVINIVSGGLQVGAGTIGSLGTGTVVDNGNLTFDISGSLTVNAISGAGSVTNDSGTLILAGNNTFAGGLTITNGKVQIGTGGTNGSLDGLSSSPIVDNGTLVYDSTSSLVLGNSAIVGTGNLTVSAGTLSAIAANTYTGWTVVGSGATYIVARGQTGGLQSSVVTNNGTIYVSYQNIYPTEAGYSNNIVGNGMFIKDNNNANVGDYCLAGNNTYTNGTLIEGGGIVLGDGIHSGVGTVVGTITFANTASGQLNGRYLRFNHPESYTFTNPVLSHVTDGSTVGASGAFEQIGPGQVTITANDSFPGGGLIDSNMVLQVGNGGATGAVGTTNSTIYDGGLLIYDVSANATIAGAIDDATNVFGFTDTLLGRGSLQQIGTGTLTLSGADRYTGTNFVANGALFINGSDASSNTIVTGGTFGGTGTLAGLITTSPGTTLVPGAAVGSVGTLTVTNVYAITTGGITYLYTNAVTGLSLGGNALFAVNKSLVPSNSIVAITGGGTLANTGTGTLTVTNVGGTALAVGDTFQLFSGPVTGGAALTITGANANWQNNLASSGSITVTSLIVVTPPTIAVARNGNTSLTLSWSNAGSDVLLDQTNSLSGTWYDYPGGATSPVIVPITTNSVYFRLGPP